MISRMFDFMFNYRRLGTILSLLVLNADNLSLAQSQEGTATVRTESVAEFLAGKPGKADGFAREQECGAHARWPKRFA